jgi:D-3-phosphoglycerate dehydrogenase
MTRAKILVMTPVRHIADVPEILEQCGQITWMDDPSPQEVTSVIGAYDAIFTNPNKSRVFIGRDLIDAAKNLKVICTASTGTNHIDMDYARGKGLTVLALTEEREVIRRISSTAELAFALTMAGLRHVVRSHNAVMKGEWDYTRYIGRQMNSLTIGVLGYGRLGSMYSRYCQAFGSRVLVYDPYKNIEADEPASLKQVGSLSDLFRASDVLSIHVHVTPETLGMINASCFAEMKPDVLLVNTARGDIVNEKDLVSFLRANPQARVATDVLANEIHDRASSPLLEFARHSEQVIITPHIGGMSREAQEIAYGHAARRLQKFLKEIG